jgi:hypothetical protein
MHDHPSAIELVQAVRGFLTDVAMKELQGHSAFHARVAANALAIVERELGLRPNAEAAEVARLQALLGSPHSDAETLNRALCDEIKAGRIDHTNRKLMAHLRQTALDQTGIDQPQYSGRQIAQAQP